MFGWTGKILRIDLETQSCMTEVPTQSILEKFIGGKGLAGYYLKDHITRNWDDPMMPLLFMTGPLVGTPAPTSGRMTVMSRSPLTGTIGDASVGGRFGTELKKAGWDGLIITGRSEKICGVEIVNDSIQFKNVDHLRGSSISEVRDHIKPKGAIAVIGPAAENSVRFANIVFDGHYAAGRNGLGLVSAAKNLKYITVKGSRKPEIYNLEALKLAREEIFRLAAASPIIMGQFGITNFGTAAIYDLTSTRRMMPTANFRRTWFDHTLMTNAIAYQKKYQPRKSGCQGCHILCKKIGKDGEVLPEFETMSHFNPLLENNDIVTVTQANQICNDAGMDTISAGATLACYAEISQKKLSGEEILALLKSIGSGTGVGAELGRGSYEYALSMGKPEASMTVKRLELPAYDPRGAYGMALGYAVSTRGGCHLRAYPIGSEILRKPVPTDRFTFLGKPQFIKIAEDVNAIVDSLTTCKFIFFAATLEEYSKAFTAITGIELTGHDLIKAGERIYYAERIMNARNGFTVEDDDLPTRFFNEPGSSGNDIEVRPINRDEFLEARSKYYSIRGLDQNGIPTPEKIKELGLGWKD
jgi:aldehyde:ferredoxin oxidoreductase